MSLRENTNQDDSQVALRGGPIGFLLMHGLGGSPAELKFLAHGLHREGYTVHCPLMAGHGGSAMLLGASTWQDWVASAEAALREIRKECDHVVVGGLSAGSIVALHLAARRDNEVDALALLSPTFWPNGWAIPWYFHGFRLITQRWFARLINLRQGPPYGIKDDRIRRFVLESLQNDGRADEDIFGRKGTTVFEFKQMAVAAKRQLGSISLPTFICHARQDDQSSLSNCSLLQRKLAGPVDTLILDNSFHMVTLDGQRHLVVQRMLNFASQHKFGVRQQGRSANAPTAKGAGSARA